MAINTLSTYTRHQNVPLSDSVDLDAFGQAGGGPTGSGGLTDAVLFVDGGNAACVFQNGTVLQLTAIPAYTLLPLGLRRINATNTTAMNIIALYHL